ncbi:cytochrome c3 family protein [Magnetospirillum gryphiswaldense]|nr:cytochrome c3 family protein [Magnetospirillum gryphiswaldense]AVM72939.1 Class III cytochrome C family protein [Magnetospirillum gryphiswaldense MSR-1]AVM76842.1 Class III cytochrome C family protein [Magnetospirillum gryphiswaldense]
MKSRLVLRLLLANLAVIAVLVFAVPHLMVSPGPLIAGHRDLETDCFACHMPFIGTPASECIACHKVEQIGRFTTKGVAKTGNVTKAAFHQKLKQDACIACHGDHEGRVKYRRAAGRFSHAMLQAAVLQQCGSCHTAPTDTLHRQVGSDCAACHSQERWKPATFDHARYFTLDRDHNVKCATCHTGQDYKQYTCYGCHEHSRGKIAEEHRKEGIRDFENCVRCHKSADEHDIRWDGRDGGLRRSRGGYDD